MKNFSHLLQLEFAKYYQNKTMRVLAVAIFLMLPVALLLIQGIILRILPEDFPINLFDYPGFWGLAGYVHNWVVYFFMVFMGVYIITMEYNYKTLRQNLITGLRRSEFLTSKLLLLGLFALVLTVWFTVITLVFGFIYGNEFEINLGDDWVHPIRNWLMCFGYGVIGLFFGLIFKSMGLSIILFFTYAVIFEPAWAALGHRNLFGGSSHLFYPVNSIKDLFPFPYYDTLTEMAPPEEQMTFALTSNEAMIASVITISALVVLSFWKMKKGNF